MENTQPKELTMKRIETSVLAGLLALGLTACSTTRTDGSDKAAMSGTSTQPMAGSTSSATQSGTSGTYGATGSAGATASTAAPNSTVTSIEVVPAQAASSATVGSEATGSSTSGTTGSSVTPDRVYRITLRTDDGSTQVVTQDWTPAFKMGDRVRVMNGAIQR
jgi:outer membrane lipoprotein SlyB